METEPQNRSHIHDVEKFTKNKKIVSGSTELQKTASNLFFFLSSVKTFVIITLGILTCPF